MKLSSPLQVPSGSSDETSHPGRHGGRAHPDGEGEQGPGGPGLCQGDVQPARVDGGDEEVGAVLNIKQSFQSKMYQF